MLSLGLEALASKIITVYNIELFESHPQNEEYEEKCNDSGDQQSKSGTGNNCCEVDECRAAGGTS